MIELIPLKQLCTRFYRVPFLLVILLVTGCAATPQTDRLLSEPDSFLNPQHELSETLFFAQEKYQCGPAALAMVLAESEINVVPKDLVQWVYVPERKGSLQVEMLATARRFNRIPYRVRPEIRTLLQEVQAGRPVLVLQNLGMGWYPQWHYAVVVGFDLQSETVLLHSGKYQRLETPLGVFENTWKRSEYWGVVMLKPGETPKNAEPQEYFLAVSAFAEVADKEQLHPAWVAGVERWLDNISLKMALANHYFSTNQLTYAASTYEQLLANNPDYAAAHNNLALVLAELGEKQRALQHANRAVAIGGRYAADYRQTLDSIREEK